LCKTSNKSTYFTVNIQKQEEEEEEEEEKQ
jgi:hypothetical protein